MTPFTDLQVERIQAAGGIVFDAESRVGAWVKTDSQLNVFPQPGYLGHNRIDLAQRTEATGPLRTAFHAHAVLPGPVSIMRSVHRAADGRPAILVATRGPFGALIGRRATGIRVLYTMDEAIDHALGESRWAVGASSWRLGRSSDTFPLDGQRAIRAGRGGPLSPIDSSMRVRTVWRQCPNDMEESVHEIALVVGYDWVQVAQP